MSTVGSDRKRQLSTEDAEVWRERSNPISPSIPARTFFNRSDPNRSGSFLEATRERSGSSSLRVHALDSSMNSVEAAVDVLYPSNRASATHMSLHFAAPPSTYIGDSYQLQCPLADASQANFTPLSSNRSVSFSRVAADLAGGHTSPLSYLRAVPNATTSLPPSSHTSRATTPAHRDDHLNNPCSPVCHTLAPILGEEEDLHSIYDKHRRSFSGYTSLPLHDHKHVILPLLTTPTFTRFSTDTETHAAIAQDPHEASSAAPLPIRPLPQPIAPLEAGPCTQSSVSSFSSHSMRPSAISLYIDEHVAQTSNRLRPFPSTDSMKADPLIAICMAQNDQMGTGDIPPDQAAPLLKENAQERPYRIEHPSNLLPSSYVGPFVHIYPNGDALTSESMDTSTFFPYGLSPSPRHADAAAMESDVGLEGGVSGEYVFAPLHSAHAAAAAHVYETAREKEYDVEDELDMDELQAPRKSLYMQNASQLYHQSTHNLAVADDYFLPQEQGLSMTSHPSNASLPSLQRHRSNDVSHFQDSNHYTSGNMYQRPSGFPLPIPTAAPPSTQLQTKPPLPSLQVAGFDPPFTPSSGSAPSPSQSSSSSAADGTAFVLMPLSTRDCPSVASMRSVPSTSASVTSVSFQTCANAAGCYPRGSAGAVASVNKACISSKDPYVLAANTPACSVATPSIPSTRAWTETVISGIDPLPGTECCSNKCHGSGCQTSHEDCLPCPPLANPYSGYVAGLSIPTSTSLSAKHADCISSATATPSHGGCASTQLARSFSALDITASAGTPAPSPPLALSAPHHLAPSTSPTLPQLSAYATAADAGHEKLH